MSTRMTSNLIISIILLSGTMVVLGACPPFSGSFSIEQQDLYPESADRDQNTSTLYLGYVMSEVELKDQELIEYRRSLFNCSVIGYKPYDKTSKVITILVSLIQEVITSPSIISTTSNITLTLAIYLSQSHPRNHSLV